MHCSIVQPRKGLYYCILEAWKRTFFGLHHNLLGIRYHLRSQDLCTYEKGKTRSIRVMKIHSHAFWPTTVGCSTPKMVGHVTFQITFVWSLSSNTFLEPSCMDKLTALTYLVRYLGMKLYDAVLHRPAGYVE